MEFIGPNVKLVVLRGMRFYPPQIVLAHGMEADLRHGDITSTVELKISEVGGQAQPPKADIQALLDKYVVVFGDIPLGQPPAADIQALLNKYAVVFRDIPPRQPPDRGFVHTIELEPGIQAVITTPYRHPKAYKDEIAKAIQELLALGHIRPSSSPFASSIVLVKDGTLHMCIDY